MHRYDETHPNTDPMEPATNGSAMPKTVRLIATPLASAVFVAAVAEGDDDEDDDEDDDDSNAYINDIGNATFQHASYR